MDEQNKQPYEPYQPQPFAETQMLDEQPVYTEPQQPAERQVYYEPQQPAERQVYYAPQQPAERQVYYAPQQPAEPQRIYVQQPEDPTTQVMSVGAYLGMFILSAIPIVNLICWLVWLISSNTNRNKKNYLIACIVFWILCALFSVALWFIAMALGYDITKYLNRLI